MVTISNSEITVKIAEMGAEIQSIVRGGVEYMWDRDPKFWAQSAPIMFPMCGGLKQGRYELDGKSYEMPKHGFARKSLFEVEAQADASATLEPRCQIVSYHTKTGIKPYIFKCFNLHTKQSYHRTEAFVCNFFATLQL